MASFTPVAWQVNVAPLAGAWIEIEKKGGGYMLELVAPLAGAWIEILYYRSQSLRY